MRPTACLFLSAALLIVSSSAHAQSAALPSGHWEGTLHMPNMDLPMTLEVATIPSGAWIGSMSLPGTTSIDVPVGSVVVHGAHVQFTATLPGAAAFDGTLSADGDRLAGEASNAQGAVPFELKRNGAAHVKIPTPSSQLPPAFAGAWQGTLDANGQSLRIGLTLAAGPDGVASATLVSVDQGNEQIPASTVTVRGNELVFEVRAVSGTYRGILGEKGEIAGTWTQGPGEFALTFSRASSSGR
jgi:hypothetical protein